MADDLTYVYVVGDLRTDGRTHCATRLGIRRRPRVSPPFPAARFSQPGGRRRRGTGRGRLLDLPGGGDLTVRVADAQPGREPPPALGVEPFGGHHEQLADPVPAGRQRGRDGRACPASWRVS